jgi:hypothetical protein
MKAFAAATFKGIAKIWTVAIIVACAATWLLVGGVKAAEAFLSLTPRVVETSSMLPTYKPGDLVWYTPAGFDDLRVGNVVAVAPDGNERLLYSHRVKQVDADGTVWTAGDAYAEEGLTDVYHPTQQDVRGVAVTKTTDATAKAAISLAQNETLRMVLTALSLGTLVMWMVVNFGLNRRDEDREQVFADRFHEIEAALVERGIISPVGGEPSEGDPLDILDSDEDSTRT